MWKYLSIPAIILFFLTHCLECHSQKFESTDEAIKFPIAIAVTSGFFRINESSFTEPYRRSWDKEFVVKDKYSSRFISGVSANLTFPVSETVSIKSAYSHLRKDGHLLDFTNFYYGADNEIVHFPSSNLRTGASFFRMNLLSFGLEKRFLIHEKLHPFVEGGLVILKGFEEYTWDSEEYEGSVNNFKSDRAYYASMGLEYKINRFSIVLSGAYHYVKLKEPNHNSDYGGINFQVGGKFYLAHLH